MQESLEKAVDYVNEGGADRQCNDLLRVKSNHVPPAIQIAGGRGQGDGIQMFKMNFRDALGQRALNLLPLGES